MNDSSYQAQPLLDKGKQETEGMYASHAPKQRHIVFFAIATTLIICGTVIWVLNIIDVIPGPWSSIFVAVSTSIGIIAALFEMLLAPALDQRKRM